MTESCGPRDNPCFPTEGPQVGTVVYEVLFWRGHSSPPLSQALVTAESLATAQRLSQGHKQYSYETNMYPNGLRSTRCYFKETKTSEMLAGQDCV